ncbi:hypothetical protein [Bradyrhizobium sp. OAE829]|uniref:hypothetical protein n=1 Tax=Bradyrhizobium sp. OAE829 TaxID=2663807 RepID=UPI00178BAAE1
MVNTTPKRILVAYSSSSTYVSTTMEYLLSLKKFTKFDVDYVHVTGGAQVNFDLNEYDVIFHSYCCRLILDDYVSDSYKQALLNFRGLKIISVQDDYDRTARLHQELRRLGFHVLVTPVPCDFWHLAYPASELPGLRIVNALTGYLPEGFLDRRPSIVPLDERRVSVAYRGRNLGPKYGRLGFDKYEIGRRMAELCSARNIPHDIAMDDASRIYGTAWFEFLGVSRTMLGCESGSNLFDFDGEFEKTIEQFEAAQRRKATYQEFEDVTRPIEASFDMGQISPRAFETAMMMTPMILFRGNYSGAMEADAHYLPLEKDFSNVDEVLAKVGDTEYLAAMADRAYRHLIRPEKYGYQAFGRMIEETIEEEFPKRVDPRWIEFRAKTHRLNSSAKAVQGTLVQETATELPLDAVTLFRNSTQGTTEFQHNMPAQGGADLQHKTAVPRPERLAKHYPFAFWAYKRLPMPLRKRVRRHLGI